MVVSPDVGGVSRARGFAKRLDVNLAIIDKRRERAGVSEVMNVIGDVRGMRCILVDDIVDSGGTLCNAADALLEAGAVSVQAYVTHGVLSAGAVARVAASSLERLVITDSIRAERGCARDRQGPRAVGGAADGRGDQPDLERELGLQPVRLSSCWCNGLSGVPHGGMPEGRKEAIMATVFPGRAARAVGQGPGAAAAARAQDPGDRLWRPRASRMRIAMPLKEIKRELSQEPALLQHGVRARLRRRAAEGAAARGAAAPGERRSAACRFPARRGRVRVIHVEVPVRFVHEDQSPGHQARRRAQRRPPRRSS